MSTQTRRKRKVGQTLLRLRDRSGCTTIEVGKKLRRPASQISKYENGHTLCAYAELTTMLLLYSATPEETAEVVSLWEDAKQDTTRIAHSSAVPAKFRAFLRAEADALSVRELQPICVPGLLQTADYAAAMRRSSPKLADPTLNGDKAIAARMARRRLLEGDQPLRLHAVIDEAAIARMIGGPEVMADQLRHLLAAARQDNIDIQIVGFDAGAYGPMSGPVTIFSFEPGDPDSVYLEYTNGGQWIDDTDETAKFAAMFEDASALALPVAESLALIEERAKVMEGL